ncbi:DNA alkylation repair protein [Bacillus sp. DTU_2020_1000418_1_SI_GHA_SEK_038]|uniref:DNA alkylation repair protein n=1 Tax=Bacillus sp. DTU_2020_1000418_1_SI_GHA_SEK_038 TaxID=3077585 RepID=UPI0028F1250F|nr:DNA alkylation repair protein [Bacillus sp. DTU_2020_1000418_1_SI_GHA_SEK_038]WNS75348.1 DNA alkylation repair protein [Bacillus sp. DTU_2020_1000418_1_SI_GHA_SEK_038]
MIELLVELFEQNRDLEKAGPMEAYMKNHFSFLGIKSPDRKGLVRQFFQESGLLKQEFQPEFVLALWEKEEREYQYAAMDYIERSLKKLDKQHLSLMEQLITTKSWWDTVDLLASKAVGTIAEKYPEVIAETIEGWAFGDHLWLRRTAILFQLKYKGQTDKDLLYRCIEQNKDSKEFFIQKAIGWALREYSKTNPESVKGFIESTSLASLSVREGSKYI